jgi:hypothetical protein
MKMREAGQRSTDGAGMAAGKTADEMVRGAGAPRGAADSEPVQSSLGQPGTTYMRRTMECSRRELVAYAAYMRAQARGFAPGHEIEDWLNAQREIARNLRLTGD